MGLYQIKHPCLVQPDLLKFILPLFLLFCDSCTLASQFCQGTLLHHALGTMPMLYPLLGMNSCA